MKEINSTSKKELFVSPNSTRISLKRHAKDLNEKDIVNKERKDINRQKKKKEYSVQDIISTSISHLKGYVRKQIKEFGSIVNVNADGNCAF